MAGRIKVSASRYTTKKGTVVFRKAHTRDEKKMNQIWGLSAVYNRNRNQGYNSAFGSNPINVIGKSEKIRALREYNNSWDSRPHVDLEGRPSPMSIHQKISDNAKGNGINRRRQFIKDRKSQACMRKLNLTFAKKARNSVRKFKH